MTAAKGIMIALAMTGWSLPAVAGPLDILSVDTRPLASKEYGGQRLVTVRFRNSSDQSDTAPWIVLPVPRGFVVVAGSIWGPGARAALSWDDGDTFLSESEWGTRDPAFAALVRWDLAGPIDPGVTGIVSFRLLPWPADGD